MVRACVLEWVGCLQAGRFPRDCLVSDAAHRLPALHPVLCCVMGQL